MPTLPLTLQNALKAAAALALVASAALANSCVGAELKEPLDRHAIVTRHNVKGAHLESIRSATATCFNVDGPVCKPLAGTPAHWGWYRPVAVSLLGRTSRPRNLRLKASDRRRSGRATAPFTTGCATPALYELSGASGSSKRRRAYQSKRRPTRANSTSGQAFTDDATLGGKTVNVTTCVTDDALLILPSPFVSIGLVRSGELVVKSFPDPATRT